ncbi:MAG: hypothetical protein AB7O57_14620 [Hyphomicrobiaceae bacterium]
MTGMDRGPPLHYKTVFETRTFLSFRLREEVLQPLLPPGWTIAPEVSGPDAGCNARFGLSDQLAAADAAGNAVEATRFCPLTVPARKASDTAEVHRIAVAYWSDSCFGEPMRRSDIRDHGRGPARQPDTVEVERGTRRAASGDTVGRQRWHFSSPLREIEAAFEWNAGERIRADEEFWVLVPALGQAYRQYRIEKVEEVVMSRSLGVDRLQRLEYRVTGDPLAALLDGTETLVSVVVQAYGRRAIHLY